MKPSFLLVVLYWCFVHSNHIIYGQETAPTTVKGGIVAYDCTAAEANVSTYSLNQVNPCIITKQDMSTTEQHIIVLQKAEKIKTKVMQCKLVIERRIQHCGMFSYTSEVSNAYSYIVRPFTETECRDAIRTGRVWLYNQAYISEIAPNITYKGEKLVVGSIKDTSCTGGLYATNEDHWDDVLVFYKYTLLVQEYTATVNVESNTIKLNNGLICPFNDAYCLDSEEGFSFWGTSDHQACEHKDYEVIFSGLANKTVLHGENHYNLGPLYTAHINTNMFAIRSKNEVNICSYKGYSTDHNRVFIMEVSNNINPFSKKIQHGSNLDLLTYFNSKIAFMEYHQKEQMIDMYVYLMNEICRLEKGLLETHITLARINPTEFVSKLVNKPGYTAVIAGEVIHVIQCLPVYVMLAVSNRCFQEIPVKYKGKLYYVAPVTRILQQGGTEINCAPMLMAKYQFSSKWYTIDKELRDTSAPLMLGSSIHQNWTYGSLGDVMNSGLYDEASIEKMKSLIYEQSNQRVVSTVVHRTITGGNPDKQQINFGHLFEDADVKSQFKKVWYDVIYWTTIVANIASSTFGMYIIFKTLKFIVDTAVHCKILTDIYGLSWKLLACFWDSLTALLEHNHIRKSQTHSKVEMKDELYCPEDQKATIGDIIIKEVQPITESLPTHLTPLYPKLPKRGKYPKF